MSESDLSRSLHARIDAFLERERDAAVACAQDLYDHPELSGKEVRSAKKLADVARAHGMEVEEGVGGLPTAFRAVKRGARGNPVREGGPTVAILAEYDALPGVGHGCGHNFIGTVGTFAALALASCADELPGTVVLMGTPSEETTGGKIDLLKAGVFKGVDAAMMVHPATESTARINSLAMIPVAVEFHGRAAHAAASPWQGRNALDAMVQLFVALDAVRKQSRPAVRIAGIITHGGERANIVPAYTRGEFSVRSSDRADLEEVWGRFRNCVKAAATATGCTFDIRETGHRYDEMRTNETLAARWERHFAAVGGAIDTVPPSSFGSLDIGNLSHHFPCIHPRIQTAPPGTSMHTVPFGEATLTPHGRTQMLRAAAAIARTAADFLVEQALRDAAWEELEGASG